MPTFLFDRIIFGPVKSRRLGVSLGVNLLPASRKVCNFNCIYCECGWTSNSSGDKSPLPKRDEIYKALDRKLSEMKIKNTPPDVITFAGNGEPTLHPEFPAIVDDCIELRNKYFPEARIAVLSNSTTITIPSIREALLKVDQNILKLDSGFDLTVKVHNQPRVNVKVTELIGNLKSFNGQLIIQTLFLRGSSNNQSIDNTTPEEIEAWLKAIKMIKPYEVMIYTISRDTPDGGRLEKVPATELKRIARLVNKLGIRTSVSG
ncbi:MAG TPA: radical SAM protein [Bacteroidales bacterium]|nr:radical SAM protein [Bacteroidales bacterium]